VNLDWHRLKAVVIESDDWGLCGWSPDAQAHRVLADTPAFRSRAGHRYGASTLESATDVSAMRELLLSYRGGDGFPPVLQANTIVGAPDYDRLVPPLFECDALPVLFHPRAPSRWQRPGLWEEVARARDAGVWWPELHGLHHVPEHAWLDALRRGSDDARRAHEQQSAVCEAVEESGEHDPLEPGPDRARRLRLAVAAFRDLFGAEPRSFCPPDYRWDEETEEDAERLGLRIIQGRGEQHGVVWPLVRRLDMRRRWPQTSGNRLYMPARIAFEPGVREATAASDLSGVLNRVRAAWSHAQPAVLSTHRANYVQLDPSRGAERREAFALLLEKLCDENAVFLTDAEVLDLHERQWSARPIGKRGSLVRYYGVPREPIHFPAPPGAVRATVQEGRGPGSEISVLGGEATLRPNVGELLVEWK
jgi:hypothetical protein